MVSFHPSFPPGPEWFRTDVWCGKCVTLIGTWEVGKTPKGWWFLVKGIYPPKCPKHSGWQNGCFRVLRVIFVVDGGGFGWGWVVFKIYLSGTWRISRFDFGITHLWNWCLLIIKIQWSLTPSKTMVPSVIFGWTMITENNPRSPQ